MQQLSAEAAVAATALTDNAAIKASMWRVLRIFHPPFIRFIFDYFKLTVENGRVMEAAHVGHKDKMKGLRVAPHQVALEKVLLDKQTKTQKRNGGFWWNN